MAINPIDILLVIVILLSVLNGYRRGFVHGVLDLAGWVLSLLAGLRYHQPVAQWLGPRIDLWSEVWDQPVAFILVALIVGTGVQIIGYLLLRRLPEDIHERHLNQVFGVIPGFVNGMIIAAILSALLLAIPLSEGLSERTRNSAVVNRLAVYAEQLEGQLRPVFGEAISRTMNLLTIRPDSDERVTLPFKVENTKPRPDLEKQMLDLVNQERQAAGLPALQADPELTEVARKHSADMFARGYFAHDTPDGLSPFDRMKQANVRYITAGENLALAPTLQIAHTGLMNSPGHRANILRREFGRVGIGVMDGGMRGLMVSQEFRN
ncbi:MAG TPA: CvpA family protein [Pyrinomonadaceae bacterium]|nr:CvpA family protein [Pyrinomonadaceae bacterium]